MNHKVFISHSSADKDIANGICHFTEAAGIPCWIAPRDISGSDWAGSIMRGLASCDVFVLVLSGSSILSPEVIKEVTEATRVCRYILPFKVDREELDDRMRYHLAACHWLDAVDPPMEARIRELVERIMHLSQEDAVFQNTCRQRLTGHTVMPRSLFLGREAEIAQIHDMLRDHPVLFLQGMGGIGKSEIARGYAKTWAGEYDTILFANYRGSIRDMLIGEDIEIENFRRIQAYGSDGESDQAFYERKLKALQSLVNTRTLLIVDNFDTDYDPQLEDLLTLPCHLLITTRLEPSDGSWLPIGPIADPNTVFQLFARNFGRPIRPQDIPAVHEILQLVQYHTITVELIAKQMRASLMTPEKMLAKLQAGGINTGIREGIRQGSSSKTAFGFIKDLFILSGLTPEEEFLMQCMCMIPHSGIDLNLLEDYMQLEDMSTVSSLISKSWLMLDQENYILRMHPIICDVVKDRFQPDPVLCRRYVQGMCDDMRQAWWKPLEEREAKWPLVEHILRHYPHPRAELLQEYMHFSNIAWICGRFPLSIEASKKVYAFTLQTVGDAGFQPAFAARAVANAYYNAGDEDGAEPYYYLAMAHLEKKPEENYQELGYIYHRVGRCCHQKGDFATGEAYLYKALDAFEKAVQAGEAISPIAPVDTYVEFTRLNMGKGDYQAALPYAQKAYDMLYAWKNCEVTSSSYCLSDMGICYSHLGDHEKASEYLHRALALDIRFNGEASMVTVRTRESIADDLARQGKVAEAKKAYLALELEMEKNFGSTCPQCLRLQAKGAAL